MRLQIQIKINQAKKVAIGKGYLTLPSNTFDIIPKSGCKLLKVQTQECLTSSYAIIDENILILNESISDYFSKLDENEILYGSVFINISNNGTAYEIYFSKENEIKSFNTNLQPIIPKSVVSFLKNIESRIG